MTERVSDILLERYLADDLSQAQRDRVESAVENSPAIQRRLEELQEVRRSFLEVDPPERFAHRLAVRFEHEASRRDRRRWRLGPSIAVALATAVVFVIAVQRGDDAPPLESAFEPSPPRPQLEKQDPSRAPPKLGDDLLDKARSAPAEDREAKLDDVVDASPAPPMGRQERNETRPKRKSRPRRSREMDSANTLNKGQGAQELGSAGVAGPADGFANPAAPPPEELAPNRERGGRGQNRETRPFVPEPASEESEPVESSFAGDALDAAADQSAGARSARSASAKTGSPAAIAPIAVRRLGAARELSLGDKIRFALEGTGYYAVLVRFQNQSGKWEGRVGRVNALRGGKTVSVKAEGSAQEVLILMSDTAFDPKRYAAWSKRRKVESPIRGVAERRFTVPVLSPKPPNNLPQEAR